MKLLPVVLVVEDDHKNSSRMVGSLKDEAIVLTSSTQRDASALVLLHPNISIVVLDGWVPESEDGEEKETTGLAGEIRRVFSGPMVAFSLDSDTNRRLMEAGCTHCCDKKEGLNNAAERIKEIIAGL